MIFFFTLKLRFILSRINITCLSDPWMSFQWATTSTYVYAYISSQSCVNNSVIDTNCKFGPLKILSTNKWQTKRDLLCRKCLANIQISWQELEVFKFYFWWNREVEDLWLGKLIQNSWLILTIQNFISRNLCLENNWIHWWSNWRKKGTLNLSWKIAEVKILFSHPSSIFNELRNSIFLLKAKYFSYIFLWKIGQIPASFSFSQTRKLNSQTNWKKSRSVSTRRAIELFCADQKFTIKFHFS